MKFSKHKTIGFVIALLVLLVVIVINNKTEKTPPHTDPVRKETPASSPISITTEKISEDNFSGKMPVVSGSQFIALEARNYTTEIINEFRTQANKDVPAMREQFGQDSPSANYNIEITAIHKKGPTTESIVMSVYEYTGGAHGTSVYKVITSSLSSGDILSLKNIIKTGQETAFTEFIKKELRNWRPEGGDTITLFPETVSELNFGSLNNWSLNDKNLVIYFGQYSIGPGALGSTEFPVSRGKLAPFLKENF